MKWYNGGIAEAINYSKSKGAIFVVYIEGKDNKSQQITTLIQDNEVAHKLGSEKFVAIKVEADSVPHQQFSEFYKQTPVPSIYFIGKSGSPIKIITESTDASSLSKELDEVLDKAGITTLQGSSQSAASASESFIKTEQLAPKPANVVCENGVCQIKPDPAQNKASASIVEGDQEAVSAEDKLERAKALLEAKRLEKEREEKELEKQRELERRKIGQEVQKMKKLQEDQELKQLKDEREKEKRLEKEARDRVLAQIAQDKADRAAKFQPAASSTPTNKEPVVQPTPGPSTSKSDSKTARLQFKMPDGSSKTQDFPSSDKLLSVVNYIKANLNLSTSKFTLATTFPRRQFTESDHSQTLAELQLTPNAVILVLPLNHGTVSTNQGAGGISGFIWSLLTPLLGILNFIKAFLGFGDVGHVSGDEPSTSGYGGNKLNSVVHVRSKYELENRLKSAGTKLVVIDFFATWCGPCRMIAPELERMAKEFPNVVFLKVDVDESGDISREYGVTAMPTFVFLKNRREVSRVQEYIAHTSFKFNAEVDFALWTFSLSLIDIIVLIAISFHCIQVILIELLLNIPESVAHISSNLYGDIMSFTDIKVIDVVEFNILLNNINSLWCMCFIYLRPAQNKPDKPNTKPPSGTTTIRKEGNVRRLADVKKDDDENNTWNGNSTQQM